METLQVVKPDADGFLPNGWVDPYPHADFDQPCYLQCCVPEAYDQPHVWTCDGPDCREINGSPWPVKLRQPGECINCNPPQSA